MCHTHTHTHTHTVIFLLREQDEINHSHISSKHLTFLLTPNSIWWLTDISYLCLASAEQAGVEFRNRKVPLFPILLVIFDEWLLGAGEMVSFLRNGLLVVSLRVVISS